MTTQTQQRELDRLDADLRQVLEGGKAAGKAARSLHRMANGDWTELRRQWFVREETVTSLLEALPHSDAKVAVDVVGTLGAASQRYSCMDRRIPDTLIPMFADAPDSLRIAIAASLPQFASDAAWDLLLQALSAKPAKAAHHAVGLAVARYGQAMSAHLRSTFATRLLEAASHEKSRDVRATMVKAVAKVGDASNVANLEELKKRAESDTEAEVIALALRAIQERAP